MMMTLFDEEQIIKNHDAAIRREECEKATKKANEQAVASLVGLCQKMIRKKNMNGIIVWAKRYRNKK